MYYSGIIKVYPETFLNLVYNQKSD